jgi:ABC-type lipoprotein export system ATPase subunit
MLALHPGERIALVGAADAGREAVIQGLAGLVPLALRPAGERRQGATHVVLSGVDLTAQRAQQRRRRWAQVGVVFERGGLWTGRSALYNLELPFRYHGVATQKWQQRRDQLIERLDLASALTRDVVELDHSQRRRVALARELLKAPSVLLFDEPQLGLSDADRHRVFELLEDERKNDMALVYGDVDGDLAPFEVNAYYQLDAGHLVPSSAPVDLVPRPRIADSPLEQKARSIPTRTKRPRTKRRWRRG